MTSKKTIRSSVVDERKNYIVELEAKLSAYNHLSRAVDDLKFGRVQNVDEVFDDVMQDLDELNI